MRQNAESQTEQAIDLVALSRLPFRELRRILASDAPHGGGVAALAEEVC